MSTFLISYRVRRDSVDRQRLVENEFSVMCGDLLKGFCVVNAHTFLAPSERERNITQMSND